MTNLDILKHRDITLLTKVHLVKDGFSSTHVWMWELDHKEGWVLKNWCFWTVVLKKTLESPLDWKEIKLLLLLMLSHFSRVRLCVTPWTAAYQAPWSLGFSRQEHWSGLPFPSPMKESEKWKWSRSVMSDPQRPHGLAPPWPHGQQPTRLLHPWDFPGKSTGVGCHCLLREIKLVNPKGNQSWIFIGRTNAETESSILWSPDTKSWLIRKDLDAGQDWRQEEKGMTEDEMVG